MNKIKNLLLKIISFSILSFSISAFNTNNNNNNFVSTKASTTSNLDAGCLDELKDCGGYLHIHG